MANIDLITGFLGAGKTTFIGKYAKYLTSKRQSFAVIENEYGTKGIDSRILQSSGIKTEELYGGCICCTLKVGFHDMIFNLSDRYDRIIVEPSGVYDISQFYAVMSSPELKGKCNVGNVICVVDPTSLDELDEFSTDMLKKQIEASGCVVLSMDQQKEDHFDKFEKVIGYKPNIIDYNDFEALYNIGGGNSQICSELSHSAVYLSTTVKPKPCNADKIKNRISALYNDKTVGNILRIKGVWNGYLVNSVHNNTEIYQCDDPDSLNIIGVDIKRKRILEILNNESD